MSQELGQLKKELKSLSDPQKAKIVSGFFKTGKGEYGEGDIFYGIKVPDTRSVVKKFLGIGLDDIEQLIKSKIHEERLCGFLILSEQFRRGDESEKKKVFDFYIANARRANNWDLVDSSAYKICGEFLYRKDTSLLHKFAKSENLWERRISIVSTYAFIKKGDFSETFRICKLLMNDGHDLIHKACGWMLREAGKRGGQKELEDFLEKYAAKMPRTMLRYSIEKFSHAKRKKYLAMK